MRRIKAGDRVKAFLDPNIVGEVVQVTQRQSKQWLVEGTASVEFYVDVRIKDGRVVTLKMSEVTHDDF